MRWRSSSKTSSIWWVRAAMPSKPMVALMPFSEWAMRKISSTVAPVVGVLLDAHDGEVELLQVLAASARNIGMYWVVSIAQALL